MIDRRLLEVATAEEQEIIEDAVRLEQALSSPVELGLYTGAMVEFEHSRVKEAHIMAMLNWKLYKSGIGPKGVKARDGWFYHPSTHEPCIRQMMVQEPPGHGKSTTCSAYLPAYHIMKWPNRSLITVTSSDDFSIKFTRQAKEVIEDHPEFGYQISKDLHSNVNWRLEGYKGEVYGAGINGQISGRRAFGVIMDDVVKNEGDALSVASQVNLLSLYDSAVKRRLTVDLETGEPGWILYIGTRYGVNDLQGQLTAREADRWFILAMPGLAYDETNEDGISIDEWGRPDFLGRKPGEPLCEAIYTKRQHEQDRQDNPRVFAALSQARPYREGGQMVSNFPDAELKEGNYYLHMSDGTTRLCAEEDCARFITSDLANTKSTWSDYTVFALWDLTPDRRLILRDIFRDRIESPDHRKKANEFWERWGKPRFGVEDKSYGTALLQSFRRDGSISSFPLKAKGDKVARFQLAVDWFGDDRIFVMRDATWRQKYEDELRAFPDPTVHDDQVDVTAYAAIHAMSLPVVKRKKEQPAKTPEQEFWDRQKAALANKGKKNYLFLGQSVSDALNRRR